MADSNSVRRIGFVSPTEMKQESDDTQSTPSHRPIFDNFLRNKQPVFVLLRFGPLCNASGSFPFSKAYCDVGRITKSLAPGLRERLLAVDMDDFFNRGFQVLRSEETNPTIEENSALNDLQNYLLNIGMHPRLEDDSTLVATVSPPLARTTGAILGTRKPKRIFWHGPLLFLLILHQPLVILGVLLLSRVPIVKHSVGPWMQFTDVHQRDLVKAIEKIKEEKSYEPACLSTAFREHLFSKLASKYSFGIDTRTRAKIPNGTASARYTATGIGHPKVWHGFVDILISDDEEHPTGAVVIADARLFEDDGDDEPTAKKAKLKDGTSHYGEESWISDQTFAKSVVFALAHERLQPQFKAFIPSILITEKELFIIMYDPNSDILVRSQKIPLWSLESSSCLEEEAVIVLWMTLHYRLFCSGSEIFNDAFENKNEIISHFMESVPEDKVSFYMELDIGVTDFHTEETEELSRDLTTHSFYKILKKQNRF